VAEGPVGVETRFVGVDGDSHAVVSDGLIVVC